MGVNYVVSFYNIGIAQESMGNKKEAVEAYRNAVKIGLRFLPSDHEILALAKTALQESELMPQKETPRPTTAAPFQQTRSIKSYQESVSPSNQSHDSLPAFNPSQLVSSQSEIFPKLPSPTSAGH